MTGYQLFIDGVFCDASDGDRFDCVNPATGKRWASAPAATADDVDRAVNAAHRSLHHGPWPALTATQRGQLLFRLADLVAENAHHLGSIETTDSGGIIGPDPFYYPGFHYYTAGRE